MPMDPPALGGVRAMRGCVGAVIEVHDDGLLCAVCCVLCAVCDEHPHRLGVTAVLLPVHHTRRNDGEVSRNASRPWSLPVVDPPTLPSTYRAVSGSP